MDTRIHYALLAIFFALLWWIIGVLSGSVVAFLIYYLSSGDSGRDWPAVAAFASISLAFGVSGMFRAWQLYTRKVAGLKS